MTEARDEEVDELLPLDAYQCILSAVLAVCVLINETAEEETVSRAGRTRRVRGVGHVLLLPVIERSR
jgi:hypothetical protein